jgi:ketosteroid isomerase-like protein
LKFFVVAVISLLIFSSNPSIFSQTTTSTEINEQVWIPFIKAFNAYDAKGFIELHATDMIRVTRDNSQNRSLEEYADDMRKNAIREGETSRKRDLALSFTERIHSNDKAFEVGYYRVKYANPDGTRQTFYGKFHVVLVKEGDRWKIRLDADKGVDDDFLEKVFGQGEILALEE